MERAAPYADELPPTEALLHEIAEIGRDIGALRRETSFLLRERARLTRERARLLRALSAHDRQVRQGNGSRRTAGGAIGAP
jgi:hypothetical protein